MSDIIDHPVISYMERTGCPDGKEPTIPRCPICDEECAYVYFGAYGAICGCNECISKEDAWEVEDCFPEKE